MIRGTAAAVMSRITKRSSTEKLCNPAGCRTFSWITWPVSMATNLEQPQKVVFCERNHLLLTCHSECRPGPQHVAASDKRPVGRESTCGCGTMAGASRATSIFNMFFTSGVFHLRWNIQDWEHLSLKVYSSILQNEAVQKHSQKKKYLHTCFL